MKLAQLQYFLSVAETNSFTKASEQLYISQPSLSVSIQKLEDELGVKLFCRDKKRIFLTSSGEYFQRQAEEILSKIQSTKQDLYEKKISKQILKIGVLETLSLNCVVKFISEFNKVSSDVLIEHTSGNIMELEKWLEKGQIDLAITTTTEETKFDNSYLLFQQDYAAAVAANHPLSKQQSVSYEELNELPFIDRIICENREYVHQWLTTKGVIPKIHYRTAHDELCKALVSTGNGLAIMPTLNNTPNITYLPLLDFDLNRNIGLVWSSEKNSNDINKVLEFLTSYFESKEAFCT